MKNKFKFKQSHIKKPLIILAWIASIVYIYWWLQFSNVGNIYLYIILLISEIYFLLMTWGYWFTVWDTSFTKKRSIHTFPSIDIYIPVCGEPLAIITNTLTAILRMKYKEGFVADYPELVHIFILNDGFVAKKENWKDVDDLALRYPVTVITREIGGGAKAGNINNAMKQTWGEYIVIFDADMNPLPDFLTETIGFFRKNSVAFVQTPQYYSNKKRNFVTDGAWAQQELFFGPICRGKNRVNAAFCCGTNVIIRRKALEAINGFDTDNIAEDFSTSVRIHAQGWKTIYYPHVLAHGLAPMNIEEYYSQQLRWAKGSIDVFFKNNPIFKRHLTLAQRIQYLLSLGYYFMGFFMILDAFIPVIFLVTGIVPVKGTSTTYILLFMPYILFIIYILSASTGGSLNYKALQFSIGSFYIQIIAIFSSIFHRKIGFKVTSKEVGKEKNFYFKLVWPHILYIIIGFISIGIGVFREGFSPAIITNMSWIIFNMTMISAHVYAAMPGLQAWLKKIFPTESFGYDETPEVYINIIH